MQANVRLAATLLASLSCWLASCGRLRSFEAARGGVAQAAAIKVEAAGLSLPQVAAPEDGITGQMRQWLR